MYIDFLLKVFEENKDNDAIVWKDRVYKYQWLLDSFNHWQKVIESENINKGAVVILETDFSPNSIALFLALIEESCIVVPLTNSVEAQKDEFIKIAQGEVSFKIDENDDIRISKFPNDASHELYDKLKYIKHPGLVLFSSGSTGKNKAIVHDVSKLLMKFKIKRHNLRTLNFLLFDHIGGIDTLFYSLSNGSCVITVNDRSPDYVSHTVEKYKVEVLPVTPTFLNFLLLSRAFDRHSLTSLKYITYGAEPMPEATLKRCTKILPQAIFLQKYGTTEVGALRSKSKSSDSLWVKIGGEGYQTRISNGILQIKAQSAMLGYLNAPNPFTEDGWFNTGDVVEVDGEYIKILGRESEIVNVGGEKVHPAEVENVIQELDNVEEAVVYGEKNPIIGNIICAKVKLLNYENPKQFTVRLKEYCRKKLQNYKIPVKVFVVDKKQYSGRFKKIRPKQPQQYNE